ncbi:LOW QUALITY PROTEIN: Fc receptor, IgE, high affinity I, gamma polypeptide like [Clinocottus analis]|uniref:LOW QUALITY PROTEIN: Fc receptor, IgE, high affinity I, gamma polypeptide like n=1 Tax=Clinocottus analis TaxID=304258 RepID=UPI0035C083AB
MMMMMMMVVVMVWCVLCAEAVGDMNICYVLDGILIFYGIVLTVLYCRLRMTPPKKKRANPPEKKPAEGGIYAGLTNQSTDVYETIKVDKKTIV